ncbi:hypothetical protein G5T42_14590 [Microbacterium sp. 4R-513]|uniref:hypothetical protein n=1 Tax=Microbacterium sp. 4R-513 TaxID=2567934 RepID=UPI0013E1E904|nr:hypothetical protein [Microbacterium sp. 4R-513]QIG40548.1 hypothetical protein G5T42_14590 [Microbacterium sp. 4R-513]
MTAMTSHQISTTAVDRALLRTASALDAFVAGRVQRRAAATPVAAIQHDASRTQAQALAAIGIMPR